MLQFPSYLANQFFVTGESFGGVYVPMLSATIVENNDTFPLNFQGFAVGNGNSNYDMNDNSLIFFANYHGLLGNECELIPLLSISLYLSISIKIVTPFNIYIYLP